MVGYAILKRDGIPAKDLSYDGWHVFEAVIRKYEHRHNCVPRPADYNVQIGAARFAVSGVLYGQQNGLNKACAHVAIRSLLSRLIPGGDISYAEMNSEARKLAGEPNYDPSNGLSVAQIRTIFRKHGVSFQDLDYDVAERKDPAIRKTQPYQKYLYAGVESGCGSLLGFSMSGPGADTSRKHIIPFYGHTFNKDTWVPEAEQAYFNIGANIGYIPSESWTSSFIGHDDNFGPNFCIPRLYVRPEQVSYVVELMHPGARYNGMIAEACALQFLYSLHPHLNMKNPWSKRLAEMSHPSEQRVVLRAVGLDRSAYIKHLLTVRDWNGSKEQAPLVRMLESLLPGKLWVVEVSIPHLFPANERKVGEVILNATMSLDRTKKAHEIDHGLFLLARLPTEYYFQQSTDKKHPVFGTWPSKLASHVPVLEQT